MNLQELAGTARTLSAGDKRLLAMDESNPIHLFTSLFRAILHIRQLTLNPPGDQTAVWLFEDLAPFFIPLGYCLVLRMIL